MLHVTIFLINRHFTRFLLPFFFFAHDFGVVIVSNFFVSIFSTRLFAEAKSWLYSAATIAAAAMASATRRHHHGRGLRGCGGRWQPQVVSLLWWWQAQTLSLSAGVSSLGVPRVPWHPQIFADQLILFQPAGTDYAQLINTGTPGFSDLPAALRRDTDSLVIREIAVLCIKAFQKKLIK